MLRSCASSCSFKYERKVLKSSETSACYPVRDEHACKSRGVIS
nr:MAG TPA: hypothetical protein [Caudoviricetes sp.]